MTFTLATGPATVGTTAVLVFPGVSGGPTGVGGLTHGMKRLFIQNPAATGGTNIAISFNGVAPTINGGGCLTLTPGQYVEYKSPDQVPNNAIQAIGSAANAPITVLYG